MSEQIDNSNGFLKDKLGDYQVNPPDKVWDAISARLGGGNRRTRFIVVLAAAASVALAITLGINYFGPDLPSGDGVAKISEAEPNSQGEYFPETKNNIKAIREEIPGDGPDRAAMESAGENEEVVIAIVQVPEVRDRTNHNRANHDIAILAETSPDNIIRETEAQPLAETEFPEMEQALDTDTGFELSLDAGENLPQDPIQDFDLTTKRDPSWMIGAVVSPLYSFRDAEGSAMADASQFESGIVAYAGGINVSYRGNSRLTFESGLIYNKMGLAIGGPGIQLFNNSNDLLFAPNDEEYSWAEVKVITNSIGNIVAKSGEVYVNGYLLNAENTDNAIAGVERPTDTQVAEQGIEQHLDYLELPFNLRYSVVDRDFELQLVGGVSANFLVDNYISMETSTGTTEIGYLTNVRDVNYSGTAGLGMIYHIKNKFSLKLEPRFRYFLNSVNDASLPSTRPYAIGIYTGLSYTF